MDSTPVLCTSDAVSLVCLGKLEMMFVTTVSYIIIRTDLEMCDGSNNMCVCVFYQQSHLSSSTHHIIDLQHSQSVAPEAACSCEELQRKSVWVNDGPCPGAARQYSVRVRK
jgi:hypothetical protein